MRIWFPFVVLVAGASLLALRQAPAESRPAVRDHPSPRDRIGLLLPSPIDPGELARYARILTLSDAQKSFLNTLYEAYSRAHASLCNEQLPAIETLAVAAASDETTPEVVAAYEEFVQMQRRFAGDLRALDARLFVQIESVLAKEQHSRMTRVLALRDRQRANLSAVLAPAAKIDLSSIIDGLMLDDDVRKRIDGALCEYEVTVTSHFVELENEFLARADKLKRLTIARLAPRAEDEDHATMRERRSNAALERTAMLSRGAAIEQRLVAFNDSSFAQLSTLLPVDRRPAFASAYLPRAYPPVYPDQENPLHLFDRALAAAIEPTVEDAVRLHINVHTSDCARINREMSNLFVDWRLQIASTRVTKPSDYEEYAAKMRRLRSERLLGHESVTRHLLALVPAQSKAHDDLSTWLLNMSDARSRFAEDGFPGG